MNEITLQLNVDLNTRRLIGRDGGTFELPKLVLGDQLRCQLRLFDRTTTGDLRERQPSIRALRAGLGLILEPPNSGSFSLSLSDNAAASGPIRFNATAADFIGIVREILPTIDSAQAPDAGCWLFSLSDGSRAFLEPSQNTLSPSSFVRIRAFQRGTTWWHEVRLIQSPLAFADLYERVLPPAPSATRIQAGGAGSANAEIILNEIQALHVPGEFLENAGGYVVKFDLRQTIVLGPDDGPEELEAALNGMWRDGKQRFKVSLPISNTPYVEFIGELENQPWPLLEVIVKTHGPGTVTFDLNLATAELAAALRTQPEIKVPFEIELELSDDEPTSLGSIITACQHEVTIVREGVWSELATIQKINWLRPPTARRYAPFGLDQILTGSQHFSDPFGDGVARSFSFAHNLGTAALHATVVENSTNGRVLVNGTDYTLRTGAEAENELILDIPADKPTPTMNALAITITTAGPRSAFVQHDHEISEVIGLQDVLDLIVERILAIEQRLPSVIPAVRASEAKPEDIEIPDRVEVYPGRFAADFSPSGAIKDGTGLPRPPGLLPALHNITISALTTPLPSAAEHAGKVYENQASSPILIPGWSGRRAKYLPPGGYVGSDGRAWYLLTRDGATNSFFPSDFERELFVLPVNDRMLRAGQSLTLEFTALVGLLKATTKAQALVVIEVGSVPSQATPAPTGVNLLDVVWNVESPLLSQRVILSELPVKHTFGAAIRRDNLGVLKADARYYQHWEGNATAPESANFALRARLIQFDTENSVPNERGFVFYDFHDAKASIV